MYLPLTAHGPDVRDAVAIEQIAAKSTFSEPFLPSCGALTCNSQSRTDSE